MALLFAPECAAFLIAIILMLAVGVLEALALTCGLGISEHADTFLTSHFDLAHTGAEAGLVGQFLGWLHVGRAPLLVLMILFLMGFAVVGLIGQWVMMSAVGFFAPGWIAVPAAGAVTLPFVRATGGLVARHFPKDETTAISEDSFVGKMATMTGSEATVGHPAEARLSDEFGQLHYLRIEPDEEGGRFSRGESVLIVSRVSGSLYKAITNPRPDLL